MQLRGDQVTDLEVGAPEGHGTRGSGEFEIEDVLAAGSP